MSRDSLSLPQARRIALAAQGFADPPHAQVTMRTFHRALARTGVLQVDSVNVLQRAHLMPLYSRLGPYDTGLLARASSGRQRTLVEYWAHVQAYMPVELWPVMEHRREFYRRRQHKWWKDVPHHLAADLIREIRDGGAATARDLTLRIEGAGTPRVKEHWGWNWSQARIALDFLYMTGELAIAGRNGQFEVLYDLPARVIPAVHLDAPHLTSAEAERELVRRAAISHGVATVQDLRDYYRLPLLKDAQAAVEDLVGAGELLPVRIDGWRRQAYLHRDARMPRRIDASTLLSPFDPVVWERARTEALFDFFYRIEIYTPAPKRQYGYYVLPFLLGDRIVARVDLKADRPRRTLIVHGAYAEAGAPQETADRLVAELRRLAGWLGLDHLEVVQKGDFAAALTVAG
ncbi:MAG TPA: crosslink repair DNA glycosylase YcaQ family protein [Nocardioides sp.]|nr:crosslink repair DNA glycosylase YcaQ family protein [Nocardioides sp.]